MIIKVAGGYLDFNADIEVERQVKVFEEISKTAGDFSYEFEIQLTQNNLQKLELPFPDNISKNVYHKINAELQGNDGITLYHGYIRIERIVGMFASCSFFSGNNNWFVMLSGNLLDVDFSDLTIDQNEANIVSSWSQNSGIVFPLMDHNVLMDRRTMSLKVEDFVASMYVHTIIKRIFQKHSIKIEGELFRDANYNRLCIVKSPTDQIESRSSYVGKTSPQSVGTPAELVTFDDDSNSPFFDGSLDNYKLASSEYQADVKMRLKVDLTVTFLSPPILVPIKVYIVKNGNSVMEGGFFSTGAARTVTLTHELILEAGDNVTISADSGGALSVSVSSAEVRFTPTYLYVAFSESVIPDWTQQDFVSNIFRLFNVITSYDAVTKTLTCNIFDKLKSKESVDISEYISSVETDYIDLVSNYGKRSTATYQTIRFEDWARRGIKNYFGSGDGFLSVDNDFIEDSKDIVESDFTNPQSYINAVFDMSMERLNTLDLDVLEDTSAGSVSDVSGVARFNVSEDIFEVGDLVRISDSIASYVGDWVVETVGSGWVEFYSLNYDDNATATLSIMKTIYTGDEDVYLFFNIPNYAVSKFSSASSFRLESTDRSSMAVGYFNLFYMGRTINNDFTQSLSFGEIDSMFFYQKTMLETYWGLTEGMLNDPVKQIATCNLPYTLFFNLDFLQPIHIKTLESSNLYYPIRMGGYKGKEYDSTIELIKLP